VRYPITAPTTATTCEAAPSPRSSTALALDQPDRLWVTDIELCKGRREVRGVLQGRVLPLTLTLAGDGAGLAKYSG
jgi:hypothetical protein